MKKKLKIILLISIIVIFIIMAICVIKKLYNYKTEISSAKKITKGYEIFGDEFCDYTHNYFSVNDLIHEIEGGDAITEWKCKICGYEDDNSNTNAPTICYSCSELTNRCSKCGKLNK